MIANHPIYESDCLSCEPITPYKETLVPHLVVTLLYSSQIYSYYIRDVRSPLIEEVLSVYHIPFVYQRQPLTVDMVY